MFGRTVRQHVLARLAAASTDLKAAAVDLSARKMEPRVVARLLLLAEEVDTLYLDLHYGHEGNTTRPKF